MANWVGGLMSGLSQGIAQSQIQSQEKKYQEKLQNTQRMFQRFTNIVNNSDKYTPTYVNLAQQGIGLIGQGGNANNILKAMDTIGEEFTPQGGQPPPGGQQQPVPGQQQGGQQQPGGFRAAEDRHSGIPLNQEGRVVPPGIQSTRLGVPQNAPLPQPGGSPMDALLTGGQPSGQQPGQPGVITPQSIMPPGAKVAEGGMYTQPFLSAREDARALAQQQLLSTQQFRTEQAQARPLAQQKEKIRREIADKQVNDLITALEESGNPLTDVELREVRTRAYTGQSGLDPRLKLEVDKSLEDKVARHLYANVFPVITGEPGQDLTKTGRPAYGTLPDWAQDVLTPAGYSRAWEDHKRQGTKILTEQDRNDLLNQRSRQLMEFRDTQEKFTEALRNGQLTMPQILAQRRLVYQEARRQIAAEHQFASPGPEAERPYYDQVAYMLAGMSYSDLMALTPTGGRAQGGPEGDGDEGTEKTGDLDLPGEWFGRHEAGQWTDTEFLDQVATRFETVEQLRAQNWSERDIINLVRMGAGKEPLSE